MIGYVDTSALARSYLTDEPGHLTARRLVANGAAWVTSEWTLVEIRSMFARALRGHRLDERRYHELVELIRSDVHPDALILPLSVPQPALVAGATELVARYALRTLDAVHLATAVLAGPALTDEPLAFLTFGAEQAAAAACLGLRVLDVA